MTLPGPGDMSGHAFFLPVWAPVNFPRDSHAFPLALLFFFFHYWKHCLSCTAELQFLGIQPYCNLQVRKLAWNYCGISFCSIRVTGVSELASPELHVEDS